MSRSRSRADPVQPHPGFTRSPSERRGDADSAEPPRQKADPLQLRAAIGNQRQQRLQRAVEQRRVNQISVDRLANNRWVESGDGFTIRDQPDAHDGLEPLAIIEPELGGEPIEDYTVDFPLRRGALRPARLGSILRRGHQPRHRMQRQRSVGEA
jgi:hypothetical protein